MATYNDITGRRSGRLTAKQFHHIGPGPRAGHHYWLCECTCGKTCVVAVAHLLGGHVRSCGCERDNRIRRDERNSPAGTEARREMFRTGQLKRDVG